MLCFSYNISIGKIRSGQLLHEEEGVHSLPMVVIPDTGRTTFFVFIVYRLTFFIEMEKFIHMEEEEEEEEEVSDHKRLILLR